MHFLGMAIGLNDRSAPGEQQLQFLGGELRGAADALAFWRWPGQAIGLAKTVWNQGPVTTATGLVRSLGDGFNPFSGNDPGTAGENFMGSLLTVVAAAEGGVRAGRLGQAYLGGEWQYVRLPLGDYAWQAWHEQVVLDAMKNASIGADGSVVTSWRAFRGVRMTPHVGDVLFRVWGGPEGAPDSFGPKIGAGPFGRSWTPVDPRTVPWFRDEAGLPRANPGRFLSEGTLLDVTQFGKWLPARAYDGFRGGMPEWLMAEGYNPTAIQVNRVYGLRPEF